MHRLLLLVAVAAITFCSPSVPRNKKYETLTFLSTDSILIEGKLWFPTVRGSGILVIDVNPCLVSVLPPDSSKKERFDLLLRQKLIDSGAWYFEFAGRKDSVLKYDRKYPSSTMFTKAEDLENVIKYFKNREDTKSRKVVLIGQSEGGMTSTIVASRNEIKGLVLISTPAVSGKEFMEYQRLCEDSLFMRTFGLHPKAFEHINNLSSLDQKYEISIEGFHRFREENYGPLTNIVLQHNNYDTIANRVINYLKLNWDREDSMTKKLYNNDFIQYCKAYKHFAYIQPEQITLYKWAPDSFFPEITCQVLVVYGTKDRKVEYSSSIKNMKEMLIKGGNHKFTAITLKDHDHYLDARRNKPSSIRDSCINNIVTWILKQ